jgi:hypothetical protein
VTSIPGRVFTDLSDIITDLKGMMKGSSALSCLNACMIDTISQFRFRNKVALPGYFSSGMVSWKARYLWRPPWIELTAISMEPSTDSPDINNDLKGMRKVLSVLFCLNAYIIHLGFSVYNQSIQIKKQGSLHQDIFLQG